MRRIVSHSVASLTLITAGVAASLVPAAGALAAPRECLTWYPTTNKGSVSCSSGTGTYRAYVRCDVNNFPDYDRYGSWVSIGATSTATCNSSDRAFNLGVRY